MRNMTMSSSGPCSLEPLGPGSVGSPPSGSDAPAQGPETGTEFVRLATAHHIVSTGAQQGGDYRGGRFRRDDDEQPGYASCAANSARCVRTLQRCDYNGTWGELCAKLVAWTRLSEQLGRTQRLSHDRNLDNPLRGTGDVGWRRRRVSPPASKYYRHLECHF